MALFILAALLVGALVLGAALVRVVRDDGLGHRPPPPVRPAPTGDRSW